MFPTTSNWLVSIKIAIILWHLIFIARDSSSVCFAFHLVWTKNYPVPKSLQKRKKRQRPVFSFRMWRMHACMINLRSRQELTQLIKRRTESLKTEPKMVIDSKPSWMELEMEKGTWRINLCFCSVFLCQKSIVLLFVSCIFRWWSQFDKTKLQQTELHGIK